MLFANSSAIITDAFPANQRGLALGINSVAGDRRLVHRPGPRRRAGARSPGALVFLVSVPFGIFGTVWGLRSSCATSSERKPAKIDWWGNVTFAVGLIAVMVGITYGIQPYGHHTMGWTSPKVIAEIGGGILVLIAFCFIETRVEQPMFHLDLFKVRAFTAGNFASLLSGIGRGGLQFVLIIWLQGIYLPRHGYSFADTPLWAGIYLLPLVAGMLFAGPIAGALSDRMGPRPFAVAGMALAALSFLLLALLPVELLLSGVRAGDHRSTAWHGHLLLAQPGEHHEQPARQSARRRRRDGGDVHELGDGAVDRDLLQPDDRRPVGRRCTSRSTTGSPRTASPRPWRSRPPTCRRWPRCSRRSWATTRSRPCSVPTSTPSRPTSSTSCSATRSSRP